MRRTSVKFELGDSHMLEHREGPYSEDKRRRAERRWKRRECILNKGSKRNCFASATRITVKSCGNITFLTNNNSHMVEDEVDKDYKMFLDTCGSLIDVESNNNDDVSNIDNDDDSDPQYKMFLENLRKEGNSYVSSVIVHDQLVDIRYEGEEEEEEEKETGDAVESQQNLETERGLFNRRPCLDVSKVPKNNCNTEEEEEEKETGDAVESQQNLETERGLFNRRPCSDVSKVPKNNCNTELEPDNVDEEYQILLNSLRVDDEGLMNVEVGSELEGRSSTVRNNSQVSDQVFNTSKVQCHINKEEEQIGDVVETQQNLETERRTCDKSPHLDVSSVSMNNCITEMEVDSADEDYQNFLDSYKIDDNGSMFARVENDLKGKSSGVRCNSQISDQAFDTPELQRDIDEDYQLFLKSLIIDGNLVHMQDRSSTKTYKEDSGSNSSDPDLILLEPNQIGENTPFICSRIYDSSWFENETNPRDRKHFSSNDHSEFRRRLMKDLERPYNQEEHDQFLREIHHQLPKERHAETRQGVVKSYRLDGVNKSYLQLYPDLANAIAEFEEPHKVLFLLRGFFFWLQNVTHDGFQPWTDKSCLEILQEM